MTATVAICALTYRRPRGLEALLVSLAKLDDPGDGHAVKVVIVDNDPDRSARGLVDSWQGAMPWELVYGSEPRRGIAFGRNTAVRLAGAVDFVAFIDDDEIAESAWLTELLRVQHGTGADVVTGTVLPAFEETPPAWALDGFFERPRFATGQRIGYARTGNVLIARRVFPPGDPAPFNEEMSSSGGEDTHFFQRAVLRGYTIVWADEAVVHESVPASRVNPRWIVTREYRRGNTLSLCLRDLQDSWWRRLRRVAKAIYHLVRGGAESLIGLLRGRSAVLAGLKHVAFGAGLLSGLAGLRHDEYAVTHGS